MKAEIQKYRELHFHVRGMDCAEEVAIIKDVLKDVVNDRDEDLFFDLMNGKLTAKLQENSAANSQTIIGLIGKTGLKAVHLEEYNTNGSADKELKKGARDYRFILCTASGILVLSGFILHSITAGVPGAFMSEFSWSDYPIPVILLYLGSVITGAWFIAPKAVWSARRRKPDMNLLMTVAAAGALIIGELLEAAFVTFLFSLALLLETWSISRARKAIGSLIDLTPMTARTVCPNDGCIEEKQVESVAPGTTVIVNPGEKIPLDGTVTKGETSVDQSAITGESTPLHKSTGDSVFAGTINLDGMIEFNTTKKAQDTTLSQIIKLVEQARSRRSPSEQWVDKFAQIYTPAMFAAAFLVAVFPPLFMSGVWTDWIYRALVLLVIGCPCALVISTPVSIVASLTAAAKAGILIKGGSFVEIPSRLKAIIFDKTGTLTYGEPAVEQIASSEKSSTDDILRIAASLETHSSHPIARAILIKAEMEEISFKPAEQFTIFPGKGAVGIVDGAEYWIGGNRFIHEKVEDEGEFRSVASKLEHAGLTVIGLGSENVLIGLIGIADQVRDNAAGVIKELKNAGIAKTVMLTGDNEYSARAVARETAVDEVHYGLLPAEKSTYVENMLKDTGETAMVGDGINDAPALATASLGIAMGAVGTDVAIETADITLMSDDIARLPWLVRHSRRTLSIIKVNIASALAVKAVFMLLASLGLATLWMAIAADMGASLAVTANSLRLLNNRSDKP